MSAFDDLLTRAIVKAHVEPLRLDDEQLASLLERAADAVTPANERALDAALRALAQAAPWDCKPRDRRLLVAHRYACDPGRRGGVRVGAARCFAVAGGGSFDRRAYLNAVDTGAPADDAFCEAVDFAADAVRGDLEAAGFDPVEAHAYVHFFVGRTWASTPWQGSVTSGPVGPNGEGGARLNIARRWPTRINREGGRGVVERHMDDGAFFPAAAGESYTAASAAAWAAWAVHPANPRSDTTKEVE